MRMELGREAVAHRDETLHLSFAQSIDLAKPETQREAYSATYFVPLPGGEVGLRSKPDGELFFEAGILTPPGSACGLAALPIEGRDGDRFKRAVP